MKTDAIAKAEMVFLIFTSPQKFLDGANAALNQFITNKQVFQNFVGSGLRGYRPSRLSDSQFNFKQCMRRGLAGIGDQVDYPLRA